jgi:hypothetical protein
MLVQATVGRTILGVRSVMISAVCRALAGIAVLSGVLAAVEIAGYKERGSLKHATSLPGPDLHVPASWFFWLTPWWAYAVAVAVGLLGLALAVLIYRGPPRGVGRELLT